MAGDPLDSLDVPVAPVGGGRRSKRSRAAVVGVIAVIAAWIGVTALAGRRADEPGLAQGSLPLIASPLGSAWAAPTIGPSRPPGPGLPEIANADLGDAPFPVFVVRNGDHADLRIWNPGSPDIGNLARFPGVFSGAFASAGTTGDAGLLVWLSPNRSYLVLARVADGTVEGSDIARLASYSGVQWERDGITALGGVAWSPLNDRFVVTERQDRWLLVSRDEGWSAREIDLSAIAPSAPSRPSGGDFSLTNQIVPAGFSQSGSWAIGALLGPPSSTWTPAARVRVADGHIEPLASFPMGGRDGLVGPSPIVDPATGRTVGYGPNGNIPGGPPQLEVREADGSYAFGVRTGIVISWLWAGDGRIVVLGADGYPFPSRWTLQIVDRDGRARTLLEAPRASGGAMFGVRNGYAGLVLTGADPTRRQIIVVRLADATSSAITTNGFGPDGPIGAGWLP